MREAQKVRLGARIKSLRQRRHLTQDALAEQVGLHTTYVAKLEAGRAVPSLDALTRLAAALDVSVASMVSSIDDAPPNLDADLREFQRLLETCDDAERAYLRDSMELFIRFTRQRHSQRQR